MTNQESTVGKEELEGKLIFKSIFFPCFDILL